MRSLSPVKPLRCVSAVLQHRRARRLLGLALGLALVPGCPTPAPVVTPTPSVVTPEPSRPIVPRVSPSAPEPVRAPPLPDIIIHQADLHGQFEHRQGSVITIHTLLVMSKARPAVGNKGVLFCSPAGAQGDSEWVPMGEVEVMKPLNESGKIQVKMLEDEKKYMIPGEKKSSPLVKKTRLRLRWEW